MRMTSGNETVLTISDMQAPFQHRDTIPFLSAIADEVQPTRIVNIGDSMDLHGLGQYAKDPSGFGAMHEVRRARRFLKKVYDIFPEGVEVSSNHNARLARTAFAAGIPEELVVGQRELTGAPEGWDFVDTVTIDDILYTHGEQFGGMYGARRAPEIAGRSVVFGHSHSSGGVMYYANDTEMLFGMNVGCMLDMEAYAFRYAKKAKYKVTMGTGVVIEGVPFFIPMLLKKSGRWSGKLVL